MERSHEQINEILWAVARGESVASMMRAHGFTRREFREWQATYGMPFVYRPPKPAQLEALRGWRKEQTAKRAWVRFRRAALQIENAEIASNDGPKMDRYEHITLRSWVSPRSLLICEKSIIAEGLEGWVAKKKPSVSFVRRLMLATTPWLPGREAVAMVTAHARRERLPMMFFGDLDPQALHWFACVRAGGRHELFGRRRRSLPIEWIGLDSRWLDWVDRTSSKVLAWGTITMNHVDCEYWQIVQRIVPDVREIIGRRASAFLDDGRKLEVDAIALHQHRNAFLKELERRLRQA